MGNFKIEIFPHTPHTLRILHSTIYNHHFWHYSQTIDTDIRNAVCVCVKLPSGNEIFVELILIIIRFWILLTLDVLFIFIYRFCLSSLIPTSRTFPSSVSRSLSFYLLCVIFPPSPFFLHFPVKCIFRWLWKSIQCLRSVFSYL